MLDHVARFEWRGEGEEAEVAVYAPDEGGARGAFERALPATRLSGVEGPVYAAGSPEGAGFAAASGSHLAPALVSAPERGLLVGSGIPVPALEVPPEDVPRLLLRRLSEVRLPPLSASGLLRVCEGGAAAAAESGLVEEEDLAPLSPRPGDPDALSRRALEAGVRGWGLPEDLRCFSVGAVRDAEGAERLGVEPGELVFAVRAPSGELGRISLALHRERLEALLPGEGGVAAAPLGSGEAADAEAALGAASNYADALAALALHALRRAFPEAGGLSVRASWRVGGISREEGGRAVHRSGLACLGEGEAFVCGGDVCRGKGRMHRSAPPFGAPEVSGLFPWEEAGLLERMVDLDPL
ncbi:hypothetical protein Rxyl_2463 [Rubrobacter xylanophilus DSM 9941]|uniref:Uncharacterized protein n=1 Tax=Rubrobacter xylanophilus (strain DSM 9941 / JCM 11954 / NBRC 16129 / PRD-1) TaxID=266117 RepID=Q1AT88_RUBXD|nr:hypothetical protein [Rubrobacter xylanophilus]ABG05390.1 hypothetical protein Rxyl_2463 [Rubrobacter xylanophilus DSM 9941]